MNRQDVIRMAREADIIDFRDEADDPHVAQMVDFLLRFAALVAASERMKIAAKLVDIGDGYGVIDKGLPQSTYTRMQQHACELAAAVYGGSNTRVPSQHYIDQLRKDPQTNKPEATNDS